MRRPDRCCWNFVEIAEDAFGGLEGAKASVLMN